MHNLFIHCGLPKTGTTSVQRFLAGATTQLNAIEFDYPQICRDRGAFAHHNLSRAFNGRRRYNADLGTPGEFLDYMQSLQRKPNIVVSSEGLTNCLVRSDQSRDHFHNFLHETMKCNDRVHLVFTFRVFWQWIESMYLHHLAIGSIRQSLPLFIEKQNEWLQTLLEQISTLRNIVGADQIAAFDVDRSDSISAILSVLKIAEGALGERPERLNSRSGLKKASLLYNFLFEPNGSFKGHKRSETRLFSRSLKEAGEFPNEVYDFHVIPFDVANEIQECARARVPDFLRSPLDHAMQPVETLYKATSLDDLAFSARDVLAIMRF
jgi:hypothetical protein